MNANLKNTNVSSSAISASTLLNSLTVKTPNYIIKIRGEVLDIRRYPQDPDKDIICYYGDIGDDNGVIEFRINPTHKLKARGQHIEITGSIKVQPNKFNQTLKVTIDGEISGEYEANLSPIIKPLDYVCRGKMTLTQFLQAYDVDKLCLLATKTASDDFYSACHLPDIVKSITPVECLFNNATNIIEGIKKASELKYVKGILITRGGSKNSPDMRVWNKTEVVEALYKSEKHFYMAVGHSDQLVLADKYCDQFFDTPYDLGASFASAINEIREKNGLKNKINSLENELHNYRPNLVRLEIKSKNLFKIIIGLSVFIILSISIFFKFYF